ncbi:hypothetical protein HK105_203740 [Polyrhizophydium stewartii]|uniref:Rhodanese domain-containing protein n=1 Tax=Polyrhizophydium stewartii TaxID=2732419 RepID=A0ABR4NAR7_9FUNG
MLARLARFAPVSAQRLSVRAFSASAVSRGLFADYVKSVKPNVKEITPSDLYARMSADPANGMPTSLHILDVRETYEWNEEYIPAAIYTGRGTLERDIEGVVPDPYDEVVVYCAGGVRSVLAADSLQKMGYKNVYSLAGGISGWKKAELPVTENFSTYSERVKY